MRRVFGQHRGHFRNVLGSLRTIDVVGYPTSGAVELTEWATELLA
jgi:hypothetical protein